MEVRASHQGYRRIGIEHQRTVQLSQGCMLVLDEVSGTGEHLLDLRFVLGPEWRVSSEMMTGEMVSCVIAGPRRLTLQCEAQCPLALSVVPARDLAGIWLWVTHELYPDPNHSSLCLLKCRPGCHGTDGTNENRSRVRASSALQVRTGGITILTRRIICSSAMRSGIRCSSSIPSAWGCLRWQSRFLPQDQAEAQKLHAAGCARFLRACG